jgi:hypothetical protein
MNTKTFRAFLAMGALATAAASSWGCVADRPSRNGVFNENQYVRKSFLVRPDDGSKPDTGWILNATVVATSTPNPLGNFGIYPGNNGEQATGLGGTKLVRFIVTQDKLQMVDMRELTAVQSPYRTSAAINAWPVTNVDLKYRINLDGEKTNFYEENQELDWQVRQWVKINFAKNDLSDMAPLGPTTVNLLNKCTQVTDASATLLPSSFVVDEENDYLQWTVNVTLPLVWDDPTCVQQFGAAGDTARRLGRDTVSFNLMYSLSRPEKLTDGTYQALEVGEKDPIRHKYGAIEYTTIVRDENTGTLQARELVTRFNPNKPIVWYFAEGFPEQYKVFFNDPNTGIAKQTNDLLAASNAKATVSFKNFDADLAPGQSPRLLGDVRYNMMAWLSDRDTQELFAGSTQGVTDPRTGETLSASIVYNDFAIKDFYVQRIDAYLHGFSATNDVNSDGDWPDTVLDADGKVVQCVEGATAPIDGTITNVKDENGKPTGGAGTTKLRHDASSLFSKMQQYLQKPVSNYGHLGVSAFIANQDDEFFKAYYALMPYYVFADPDMNQFVIREGGSGVLGPESSTRLWKMMQDETEFQQLAAKIDRGEDPFTDVNGPQGSSNALGFLNRWRDLTKNHKQLGYERAFLQGGFRRDAPSSFSFDQIMLRDARHCVNQNGSLHWETKQEWTDNLITTYWQQVAWHEFGHAMGLMHNFMASVDKNNFPHYQDAAGDHIGLYASSVMEYNSAPDRVFRKGGWAPYDKGAIAWIYANGAPSTPPAGQKVGISGQASATAPWVDPLGFDQQGKEIPFLYCSHQHLKYTPFCRMGDAGTTPSEIIANQIDSYEWQYQWRNFRTYRKIWDNSQYVNGPADLMSDMRKFMSLWAFDWGSTEITDTLRRIGVKNPDSHGSDQDYYNQLTNKFNKEASMANQIAGAFHKAIIQQATGERPYRTIYDKYYGDVTQQGIILDKLLAMQGWVGLWNTDNYDQNQAGFYIASYTGFGDSAYQTVAEDAVESMVGGQYDVYPYFKPLAVAQFAQDTHNPNFISDFSNRKEVLDWIGGWVFYREVDFLNYFRRMAVQFNTQDAAYPATFAGCTKLETCTYDPQPHRQGDALSSGSSDVHHSDLFNEFIGPDGRRYSWAFVPDRNTWVVVDRDRHTATYQIIRTYNQDIVNQQDDGAFPGGAYSFELQLKYFLDYYKQYNDFQSN